MSIYRAEYGAEIYDALIERIKQFKSLKWLLLFDSKVVGEDGGQEVGVCLAEVLSSNNTVETLGLEDLINDNNKEQWGVALLQNETITRLALDGVESNLVDYLKAKTAERSPQLEIKS